MNSKELHERLLQLSTTGGVEYVNRVTPGSKTSLGVRVPELRKIAKEIAKGDYGTFLREAREDYWEYEMLKAFVIGYIKTDVETVLFYATEFIPKIHDWSVNDAFCQTFFIARKNKARVYEWLMGYVHSDKEYEQRVVAVILMSHFLDEEYIDRVLVNMNELTHPGYYTKMGVAWAVATAYAKFPEKTHAFMLDNKLDDWTYNKSIQKMIESYRVSDADKEILRKMKR